MCGRTLVIGNNTIDAIYRIPGAISRDAKHQAESFAIYPGGQAANVAHTLALLRHPVEYLGAFGDDDASAVSRRSLVDIGVEVGRCVSVPHCPVHQATVVVDTLTGRRTIIMFRDNRLYLDRHAVTPDLLDGVSEVYLDNHEHRASLAAARIARERGIPVIADLEEPSAETLPILAHVDVLIAPAAVLRTITGKADPGQMVRAAQLLGPRTVVATAGADRVCGVDGPGEPIYVPSVPCSVVDSTGAGDAFHAGYIAALRHGASFDARLRFAARVGSLKCGVSGPRLTTECVGSAAALA